MGQLTYYISNVSNDGTTQPVSLYQPRLMSRSSSPSGIQTFATLILAGDTGKYAYVSPVWTGSDYDMDATVKPAVPPINVKSGGYLLFSDLPITGEFDPGTFLFSYPIKAFAVPFSATGHVYRLRVTLHKFRGPRTFANFLSTQTDIGGGVKVSQDISDDAGVTPTTNGVFNVSFPTANKIKMNNEYLALSIAMYAVNAATEDMMLISRTATNAYLSTPNFIASVDDRCVPIPANARESYTYIAPDGTEYPLDVPNMRAVLSGEGEGVPPINYITQRGPFQDGVSFVDNFLQPRIVQLVVRHQLKGRTEYHNARQELVSILSPRRQTTDSARETGVLRKQLYDGTLRDLNALILQGPNFNPRTAQWDEWAYQEVLRFQAFDPVYLNPVEHSQAFAKQGPNLIGPITGPIIGSTLDSYIDIDYDGEWRTYPRFTILGPATFIEIEIITTMILTLTACGRN